VLENAQKCLIYTTIPKLYINGVTLINHDSKYSTFLNVMHIISAIVHHSAGFHLVLFSIFPGLLPGKAVNLFTGIIELRTFGFTD